MSDAELPLLLGPGRGEPESLLLIGARESDGYVAVRRWTANDWSAPHPVRREPADALLRWLEAQASAGRSMNQSLYRLKLWLTGQGTRGE